jgi:hypothetical protein
MGRSFGWGVWNRLTKRYVKLVNNNERFISRRRKEKNNISLQ